MIETLFQQQRDWVVQEPLKPLMAIARQAGFTEESFKACLKNQQIQNGIAEEQERAAKEFNVQSTPTFFINGKLHRGDFSIEELAKEIEPYLQGS